MNIPRLDPGTRHLICPICFSYVDQANFGLHEDWRLPTVAKTPTMNGLMDTLLLMMGDFVPKKFEWQRREVKEWDLQKFKAVLGDAADFYLKTTVNAPAVEVALKQGTLRKDDLTPAYSTKASYALVTG